MSAVTEGIVVFQSCCGTFLEMIFCNYSCIPISEMLCNQNVSGLNQ